MKRTTVLITSLFAVALSVAAVSIGASMDTPRTLMSPVDYRVAKRAIEGETRTALAHCRGLAVAARDICKAEVRAGERVKKADLTARYHGTFAAQEDARAARIRAVYDVAKARCGVRVGDERLACLREARQGRNRQLADARPAAT